MIQDIDQIDPKSIVAVPVTTKATCEKIVIVTGDGRKYNLGKPDSIFFKFRVAFYRWQRRKEFNNG